MLGVKMVASRAAQRVAKSADSRVVLMAASMVDLLAFLKAG